MENEDLVVAVAEEAKELDLQVTELPEQEVVKFPESRSVFDWLFIIVEALLAGIGIAAIVSKIKTAWKNRKSKKEEETAKESAPAEQAAETTAKETAE